MVFVSSIQKGRVWSGDNGDSYSMTGKKSTTATMFLQVPRNWKERKTPVDYGRLDTNYSIKQMVRIALIKLVDSDTILYQATTSCNYLDFTHAIYTAFLVEVN